MKFAIERRRVFHSWNPHIHLDARFGRHHVYPRASGNHAGIHRDTAR